MWPLRCLSVGRMLFVPVSWVTPFKKMSKEKIKTSLSTENNTAVQIPKECGSSSGTKSDSASYIIYRYVLIYKLGFESRDKTTTTVSHMVETKSKQLHWPNGFNPGVYRCPVPCCSRVGLTALAPELCTHKTLTRNYSTNQDNESVPDDHEEPKGFPRLRSPVIDHISYMTVKNPKEPWKNEIQRKAEPLNPDNKWKQT